MPPRVRKAAETHPLTDVVLDGFGSYGGVGDHLWSKYEALDGIIIADGIVRDARQGRSMSHEVPPPLLERLTVLRNNLAFP